MQPLPNIPFSPAAILSLRSTQGQNLRELYQLDTSEESLFSLMER